MNRFHPASLKTFAIALVTALLVGNAVTKAQTTVTFTVAQAPCNNDGVLVAEAPSFAVPPVTFNWYIGNQTITHVSNTLFDTLTSYSGAAVSIYAVSPGGTAYGYFAGQPPFDFDVNTTPAVCPALGSAEAIITGGGTPPYALQWIESGTTNVASTNNPAALPAGSYSLYITDAAGCAFFVSSADSSITNGIFVQNNSPVVATAMSTPASCANGTATTMAVGGTQPYSYAWSNGANSATISGLTMGAYQVTVTDAQGCYGVAYTYVQQSVFIGANPTVTNATCLENDGSVTAFPSGGMPPYTYQWEYGETSQTINNLTADQYSLTVTDANGCIGLTNVNVQSNTPITVTHTTTPSSCTSSTGSATLAVAGGTPPYNVNWNTYPSQSGITASNLPSGSYGFHIVDAAGCVRNGFAYIPPISVITANVNTGPAMCTQANGVAAVVVLSGATPYTYSWSNGATNASIANLSSGSYSVTVTDAMSCSLVKNTFVGTSSPINIGVSATPASCIFANDGNLSAMPTGGTPPYTYWWSNGSTNATANNLTTGNYWVYVTDAAGCVQNTWSYVGYDASNDDCFCTITGTVYEDINTNCTQDLGEPGIQNVMVHCSGVGYDYTNANGVYSFIVPTGSYTVSENVQFFYPLAPCQNNNVPVNVTAASGCVTNVDFANTVNPVHDVRIVTVSNWNPPVPGNDYVQKIVVTNDGSVTENDVRLGYKHDGQLNFASVSPSLFTLPNASFPEWYRVDAGFPALAPSNSQTFNVTYNVPTNIPLGTLLQHFDTVSYATSIANWLNDYTPWNNVNTHYATVVGSFDPNYKEVTPQGTGEPGYIKSKDSVLTYTVHFQNTGTWPAQKVVIKDTIDQNLQITTLSPGYSTHNYEAKVSEDGVVTFTFNNIMLPDSGSNLEASQGLVMYSIHLKPNLPELTEIKNTAAIYFDYNAPVITNTTLNTIDNGVGISEVTKVFDFMLFPNPTHALVTVAVNTDASGDAQLIVHNLLGQQVQSQNVALKNGKNLLTTDMSKLPTGVYVVELKQGQSSQVKKLNVIK